MSLALRQWKGAVQPPRNGWTKDLITDNQAPYSEDLEAASWGAIGLDSVVDDALTITDRGRTVNLSKLTEDTSTGFHDTRTINWLKPEDEGLLYSCYCHPGTGRYINFSAANANPHFGVVFDTQTETFTWVNTTIDAPNYGYEALSDGVYRIWFIYDGLDSAWDDVQIGLSESGSYTTYTGTGRYIYAGGFMVEPSAGKTGPSKYIFTGGTTRIVERQRTEASSAWATPDLHQNYLFYADDLSKTTGGHYSAEATGTIAAAGVPPPVGTRVKTTWTVTDPDGNFAGWRILDFSGVDNKPYGKSIMYSFFVQKTSGATTFPGATVGTVTPNYLGGMTINTNTGEVTARNATQEATEWGIRHWDDNWWRCWIVVPHGADAEDAARMTMVFLPGVEDATITGDWLSSNTGANGTCGWMAEDADGKSEPSPFFDPREANGNDMPYYRSPNNVIYLYKGAVQPTKFPSDFRTRRRGGASVFDEMGQLQQQIYARKQKKQLLQLAALAAGVINRR